MQRKQSRRWNLIPWNAMKYEEISWAGDQRSFLSVFFLCLSESWLTLRVPVSLQMVFFLVLDILWFIVSVAGVVFTFLLWVLYHIFVSSSAREANCFMKDDDTCYCERKGERDVEFSGSKCDHSINMSWYITSQQDWYHRQYKERSSAVVTRRKCSPQFLWKLRPPPQYAGGIWKRIFHSKIVSNIFRLHEYPGGIWKRWGSLGQRNHVNIAAPSFSKSPVFKRFSVQTKMKTQPAFSNFSGSRSIFE